ncbi:glycosyltransferase family 2 protein [Pseudomonadota bacterium]
MTMTVSVVIPVYNGAQYLAEALDSVVAQTVSPQRIILVDDGSSDDSRTIAQRCPQVQLIETSHQGVADARNTGIEASDTTLIAFLDQDDIWLPQKLEKQLALFDANPSPEYVLALQSYFLEPGINRPAWLKADILQGPQEGSTPSALVVRKSLFSRIGYFDPRYPNASDVDWFFRAKDMGIPHQTVEELLVRKRVHADNQSERVMAIHREILQISRASIMRQKRKQRGAQ